MLCSRGASPCIHLKGYGRAGGESEREGLEM